MEIGSISMPVCMYRCICMSFGFRYPSDCPALYVTTHETSDAEVWP